MSQKLSADNDPLRKRPSPTAEDEYDFDVQHEHEKRMKLNGTQKGSAKFFTSSRRQITYSHNWSTKSGKAEEQLIVSSTTTNITNDLPSLGRIKRAQQCVDSGELADFSQELDYILSTLLDKNAYQNLKHLSAIQLAKKCTIAEFRRYLRTQNVLDKIFSALSDVQGSPMISLTTATIIYFLARDQKSVPITDVTIRLISDLLRQEQNWSNSGEEFKEHTQSIWFIFKDWLNKCTERMKRPIHFGVTESTMTASVLMLEALAYISAREQNDFFKTELLNSGCLQWVVAKLDKAVLKISYSSVSDGTLVILEEIERCFRILENAAAFNKKNQAYLINHRNGLLLEAGAKFLSYFKNFCEKFDNASSCNSQSISEKVLNELLDCIGLLARVFMNVSHENEFCSKKLGQKDGFLHNCVTTLTSIAPSIVPTEKFFDLCVMMYGLLVNLVERCAPNRQKLLETEVFLYDVETKNSSKCAVLDALTKLFVKHDTAAVKLDEELDNELAFEEPTEDDESSNQETNALSQHSTSSSTSQDEHRLQRPAAMTEDDVLNAVKGAMSKASAHMEDSMLASYLSLLVGCLLRTDQDLADHVKTLLPDGKLSIMIEQLERFLEFMKLTKMKSGATRSIEQIIQSMQLL